jgi:hypothetical protein
MEGLRPRPRGKNKKANKGIKILAFIVNKYLLLLQ